MFTEETVLVLGAGSSVHCGYPTGEKIINNIKWSLAAGGLFADQTNRPLSQAFEPCRQLLDALEFFDPISIDSFLEQNSNNADLVAHGKRAIITDILTNEHPDRLRARAIPPERFDAEKHCNWYRFLWHALISPNQTHHNIAEVIRYITENELRLKIITFNYDVSLDYFLYTRINDANFITTAQKDILWNAVRNNIVHMYGHVDRGQMYERYGEVFAEGVQGTAHTHLMNRTLAWNQSQGQVGNIHVMGREHEAVTTNSRTANRWLAHAKKIFWGCTS